MSPENILPLSKAREKILARLRNNKFRREERLFLAEGVRLVEEAVENRVEIEWAVVSSERNVRADRLVEKLLKNNIPVFKTEKKVFQKNLDVVSPQPVAAVCRQPENSLDTIVPGQRALVVICDGLQEPGNLGAVIRVAAAAGADTVITTPGTVDVFNPKVLRGSMGSCFRIPVIETEDMGDIQKYVAEQGFAILKASVDGENVFEVKSLLHRVALVLGSEAHGTDSFPQARKISIPMFRNVESLNVAVAAGILLYEIAGNIKRA